jgi:type IV secretion system protein VirD4
MNRPARRGGGELALVVLAAVLAMPLAAVWTCGRLAAALSGARALTLSQASRVLARLPGHLAAPELAWPTGGRAHLPTTAVLDALLLLSVLGCIGLLAGAAVLAGQLARRGQPARAARLARRGELAALRVAGPQPGRVTLGEYRGRLLAAEARASVLGVGPSQSGKSTGLIVPAILQWLGPVLSTSVKADVVHDTRAARAQVGEVLIFDPTRSSGLPTSAWSPLAASRSWQGARRTAAHLLGVGEGGTQRSADESFWRPAGARYLAPLLLAAAHAHLSMADVLRWIATGEQEGPHDILEALREPGAQEGSDALRSVWQADHRLRSSLLQTIATALDAWQEPEISQATGSENEITPARLLDGHATLYLVAPAHEQRRLRGLFTALLADLVACAFERSALTGQPINPPLLLALDEVANIAPLPNLDELASTGPGQGVQLLTVFQNIAQAQDRWGRERAETIIANHRARLFLSGIGDPATLEHLRHTLGEEEITRISTHRPRPLTVASHTHSSDFRVLAAPHRIRQADTHTALLVYGRLAPAWIALRPWYAHRQLRALITGERPLTDPSTQQSRLRRVLAHTLPRRRTNTA